MLAGLFVAMFFQTLSPFKSQIASLYWANIWQNLLAFIGAAYFTARFVSNSPTDLLKLKKLPTWKNIAGIIVFYIVALPAMNQIIYWNSEMHLPDSMSSIESYIRQMEDLAQKTTDLMMSSSSIWQLIAGILFIGILTGFSEEIFFRGALQDILASKGARHVAIWGGAIIFSAVHFQFFGFFPRLLLGAWFGYLLAWTGSLYTGAIAHALNNSIVVVTYWLTANGISTTDADKWGIAETGFPLIPAISALAFVILIIFCRKYFFPTQK